MIKLHISTECTDILGRALQRASSKFSSRHCKVNHRLRQLGSLAVLSAAMGVTCCWVWDSLPCAAWCLLRCYWPDMISSIYPLRCFVERSTISYSYLKAHFMTYLQTEKTNLYSHKDYSATRAGFLVRVCHKYRNFCNLADKRQQEVRVLCLSMYLPL